jgi:hypothetical protein
MTVLQLGLAALVNGSTWERRARVDGEFRSSALVYQYASAPAVGLRNLQKIKISRKPLKSAELQEPVAGILPRGHEISAFSSVWQFI